MNLDSVGLRAKSAAKILAGSDTGIKNGALTLIAKALTDNADAIIAANAADVDNAKAAGMKPSMLDRLTLTGERIAGMAQGVSDIAGEDDPVGKILSGGNRPNGLKIKKVSVPLGVVGIIYEARPNVTSDAAALCLKSGNACILRGGKEAINSNKAIVFVMRNAVETAGLPADCICFIEDTSRESAAALMKLSYLDCLIPRGGAGLIRSVVENSTVPVIETGVGNCHIYVEKTADIDMAARIVFNAKTQRPSVCNAAESLLVDRAVAKAALPVICGKLREKNVEIRGCAETLAILDYAVSASDEDYFTEFLDDIISVKVVDDVDEAIAHIGKYSSGHSESIITGDYFAAEKFTGEVDSAAVYVNASTRFTDGAVFGLGAEVGISTQKLHARGPMGLSALTSTKFIVNGSGQVRE